MGMLFEIEDQLKEVIEYAVYGTPMMMRNSEARIEEVQQPTRFRYERDALHFNGLYRISYAGNTVGVLQCKPHPTVTIAKNIKPMYRTALVNAINIALPTASTRKEK